MASCLVGCTTTDEDAVADIDCSRMFCGCWTEHSIPVRLRVAESDDSPVVGARLTCHDDDTSLGTTDPQGVLTLDVAGRSSPGCGFMPDCQIAYLRMDDGSPGRPFWLGRLAQGEDLAADDSKIEILAEAPATSPALPDPLEAGWNGAPVCEKLRENPDNRVLRCSFPPATGHERHYHDRHFGYAIAGGRMQITDANGTREVDLATGSSFSSDGVDWHEVLNVGETTVVYLIVEPR